MARWILGSILLFASCTNSLRAQPNGDSDLAKALALEKVMQKIIRQNEVSIACILVSRSEAYHEFGQGPDKDKPGKLGAFDRLALENHPRYTKLSLDERKHWNKQLDFVDPAYIPRAFGSGVVVDAAGLVLTNYHVVQDATKIFVRLPGGLSSYADIHAADPRCDLAVLRLLNPDVRPLKAITLGDADKIERGQFLLTMSNPFAAGFRDGQPSASWGILSNIRRRATPHMKEGEFIKPFHCYNTLLQTDARLHLGCSGGALFNLQGEMVGMLSAMAAIQGAETPGGFAIPVNTATRRLIDVLKRGEEIDYGFLGVSFNPPNGRSQNGVVVTGVSGGSPARLDGKIGLNDVILAVDGQPIHDADDIYTTIGMNLAGTKVRLRVRQKGIERVVDVTLAKLNVPGKRIASSLGSRPYYRGLRVDYSSLVAQQILDLPRGVLVTDIQPNTAADRATLKTGDIITHVNGLPVPTPAVFYQTVNDARGALELTLHGIPNKLHLK